MSVTLITSLLVQVTAIALLRHRLGRHWLRRPVTLLVLPSLLNQGIGPVLLAIPSVGQWDNFRLGIQQSFIDSANLLMSAAMLALTVAYLLTRPERTIPPVRPTDAGIAARTLDWRMLACACLPLAILTSEGRGYNGTTSLGQGTSLSTDLAATFFQLVVVLAAMAFLLRHGTKWFLPVLMAQSGLLAIAGERSPVIMDAVGLIVLLLFAGVRVPRIQLLATGVLTVLVIIAITGVRVHEGRGLFYANSGVSARVGALAHGLSDASGPQSANSGPGLVAQAAVRLSGVDFGGGVLQSISFGQPWLSPTYVPESLLLAVPSFVWSSKLSRGNSLNPAQLQINDFGLQQVNFIPALPGLYLGFLSPAWLMSLFSFLGLVFGWGERWLLRECTPVRLVWLAGAVIAALWYEAGLPTMLLQMRAALAVVLMVKVIELLRAHRPIRSARHAHAAWPDRSILSEARGRRRA